MSELFVKSLSTHVQRDYMLTLEGLRAVGGEGGFK